MGNIEITPELLAELKEKAENINPDQWKILYPKDTSGWGFCVYNPKRSETIARIKGHGTVIKNKYIGPRKIAENNAEYIAAANPAVMLALIAKIEQLEKEADWLAARLQTICKHEVPDVCAMLDVTKCPFFPGGEILMKDERIKCKWEPTNWRNAAKEAVKSNEQADK